MKLKRLVASFFVVAYLISTILSQTAQPVLAAGTCGDTNHTGSLYQGKYLTGCYVLSATGKVVPESGWDCGPGKQCYYFDQYKGICSKDFYTDSSGKKFTTFCSVSALGRQTADGYPGCGFGQFCVVGDPVGNQTCDFVLDKNTLKFCIGGFSSATALTTSKLTFSCTGDNCGVLKQAFSNQTVDLSTAQIGDAPDGKYTCYDLYFNPAVKDALSNPLYLNNAHPTIQGQVNLQDGSLACMRQLTLTKDANGNPTEEQSTSNYSNFNLCRQIPPTDSQGHPNPARSACDACDSEQKVWTAVGCITPDFQSIASTIIKVGLSLAGGFALLMILAASFMLTTSQGDLKRAGDARELITSAVMGLLFIIFSVTILEFIGVKILQIPGFGV